MIDMQNISRSSIGVSLRKQSQSDLDYDLDQKVRLTVSQGSMVLSEQEITVTDTVTQHDINFVLVSHHQPVVFDISTVYDDPQFNLDNSVVIDGLILDGIFLIPRVIASGTMRCRGNDIVGTNTLFGTGSLRYELMLPFASMVFEK